MSIAVVTVTRWNRVDFLRCIWDQICNYQTRQPDAWLIVDASTSDEDQDKLANVVQAEFKGAIKIDYHNTKSVSPEQRVIGRMREISRIKGLAYDFIVVMDDDDWNYPERIAYSVKQLKKFKYGIAGCTAHLIASHDLGNMFQIRGHAPFHSVNCFMAYTKGYAQCHKYDAEKACGEEPSFTHNFQEPMVQLDPFKTAVQLSHSSNTFDKMVLLCGMMLGMEHVGRQLTQKPLQVIRGRYSEMIADTYKRKGAFDADIVYFCGVLSIEWGPKEKSLGGSEQAVVHLSIAWAAAGYKVVVYGNFTQTFIWKGVKWIPAKEFSCLYDYAVLILWRPSGMSMLNACNLRAAKLIVDLHDNSEYKFLGGFAAKLSHVMVKSVFHQKWLDHWAPGLPSVVVPNGIRVTDFLIHGARRPKHLIYASCYARGLQPILETTWPILHKLDPDAVLHVCYGMIHVRNQEFKEEMESLLKQEGIIHHGRLPVEDVSYLKATCGYHLYYTESLAEIDCISIRESLVAGCTPILSNVNVFAERTGYHLGLGFEKKSYVLLAQRLSAIINQALVDPHLLRQSPTILTWEQAADKWADLFPLTGIK